MRNKQAEVLKGREGLLMLGKGKDDRFREGTAIQSFKLYAE